MKKQKVILLDSEHLSNKDLDAIKEIQVSLNKVDQFPVYSPDLQWFEHMVLAEQEKTRKKLVKDISIFIIVAVLILSGLIVALYNLPIIFIFMQIITTMFIAVYSGIRYLKQVKLNE